MDKEGEAGADSGAPSVTVGGRGEDAVEGGGEDVVEQSQVEAAGRRSSELEMWEPAKKTSFKRLHGGSGGPERLGWKRLDSQQAGCLATPAGCVRLCTTYSAALHLREGASVPAGQTKSVCVCI